MHVRINIAVLGSGGLLILWLAVGICSLQAQRIVSSSGDADDRISLSGNDWRFMLAASPTEAERFSHFYQASFDARNFRPVTVPSNWAMQGFEEPMYDHSSESEGFYLRRFQAPASLADKRVLLHFDGVWDSAEVWLNGQLLGRHDSGFTGFAFDATPHLKLNAENSLAVRVRQQTKDSSFDENDDWALGGIYRDVWLEFMPSELYIDRVEAVTDLDEQFRDASGWNLRFPQNSKRFAGSAWGHSMLIRTRRQQRSLASGQNARAAAKRRALKLR